MKRVSKLLAVGSIFAMLGVSSVADAAGQVYIPHDKPISQVIYYTDGRPFGEAEIFGFEVQYCDLTTYREGGLTLWPHFEPYDEC